MSPIRVLLADDHPVVRNGIRVLLENSGDIEVVGEAANGVELLDLAEKIPADLVLLDIQMKKMNGLVAGELLKSSFPDARFIIVSNFFDKRFCRIAKSIGAEALISKENLEELYKLTQC